MQVRLEPDKRIIDLEEATELPNDKLLVSGFRRTGFLEDEH
jgi:hypothetical protein